ncbi:hypothetical protein DET50_11926 [Marinobacter pelagius]|uniref:Uncharacterized protein n=1 Tax=Marinobacter pelagius TaxID=379482 RepID=A0A366GGG1_9GAMM|nr:hypothetical protein [Marinobacter pelagius]RBP26059.1 hypothetical protein DET50_11926 [Marinobacter pelagius]
MDTLASEREWLLNPSLLKLVHQCRRLIHSEFGVKLHLTEQHLEQQLADYAGKSRSGHLVRTWEALKAQVPQLQQDSGNTDDENPRRMYRGQAIADDRPARSTEEGAQDGGMPARKKQVIYRGQVIG